MAAIRGKRKREIQDENGDFVDNFQALRHAGESKKRRLSGVSPKPEIKDHSNERLTRSQVNLSGALTLPPMHPSPMRRRDSLMRIRKPLMTLRGSIRGKIAEQVKRSMMKGKQDYNLPIAATEGQLGFLHFVSALDDKYSTTESLKRDQYLQEKIDHEIRMRDGTAKLLAASKRPQQMLEAAKSLVTSNSRMMAYMSELQTRKTDEVMKKKSKAEEGNQVPCKASVSISDVRIPLMWKDTDHFKNKGDHRRYAVFCLVKIGTEIQDTGLIKEVDRCMTDLTFDEPIVFDNVKPDFECRLEVYRHRLTEDLTMASTPKKIKKRINNISNSVGRSVGRRLSGLKDDQEFMTSMLVGPKFDCVAHATLKLDNVGDVTATHDLTLENLTSNYDPCASELPLFDNFCCRMAAQPLCMTQETASGNLNVKVRGRPGWTQYWCQLQSLTISCWPSQEDASGPSPKQPTLVLPVTKTTQISEAKRDDQDFCLCLRNRAAVAMLSQVFIATSNQSEISRWWLGLQQHLLDQVMWRQACDTMMSIDHTSPQKTPSYLQKLGAGLDQVIDPNADCDSPMTKILNRLNVDGQNERKTSARRASQAPAAASRRQSYGGRQELPVESPAWTQTCMSTERLATTTMEQPTRGEKKISPRSSNEDLSGCGVHVGQAETATEEDVPGDQAGDVQSQSSGSESQADSAEEGEPPCPIRRTRQGSLRTQSSIETDV